MRPGKAILTIDGRELEVVIDRIDVNYDTSEYNFLNNDFTQTFHSQQNITMELSVVGGQYIDEVVNKSYVDEEIKEKEDMSIYRDEECVAKCEDSYENYVPMGKRLVKKLNDLTRSEDDKLMLKYKVVDEDFTITETGKELLLNLLLADNSEVILENLKKLEADEEKAKKKKKK